MNNDYKIIDSRNSSNFKYKTFSGYKKTDVMKALINSIDTVKIDQICNWTTECIISGYTIEIFEKIYLHFSLLIHINNPTMPFFLHQKMIEFTNFCKKYNLKQKENILLLRNEPFVRNILFCIIILISISLKTKKIIKPPSIKKTEFQIEYIEKKLSAHMNILPDNFIKLNEPDELKIIINEIYFNLKDNINGYNNSIYWISWILEWEKVNKKHGSWSIDQKNITNIKDKYKADVIWIIWNIILIESKNRDYNTNLQITSLYHIYKHEYTIGKKYKRLPYLYNSILYLTNNINYSLPLITNKSTLLKTQLIIDKYFKSKKINEYNEKPNKGIILKKPTKKEVKKNVTEKEIINNKINIFNNLDPIN